MVWPTVVVCQCGELVVVLPEVVACRCDGVFLVWPEVVACQCGERVVVCPKVGVCCVVVLLGTLGCVDVWITLVWCDEVRMLVL